MKLTYAMMAAMLAFATVAVQGDPYGPDCASESLTDGNGIECLSVTGPGSVTVKPVIGVGAGACTDPSGLVSPIPCFTAGSSAVGAAIFPGNSMPASAVTVSVSFWAEWVSGQFISGFDMTSCNDRDYDSICTNVGDNDDQLRTDESNEPIVGADCNNGDKDNKDCPDPTDAERANFCMMPAIPISAGGNGPSPWNSGQQIVFIGNWASADPGPPATGGPTNIGHGNSAGTYDVWMKVNGTGCTPPQCDDKIDNEAIPDGAIDFDDAQCSSYDDNDETL